MRKNWIWTTILSSLFLLLLYCTPSPQNGPTSDDSQALWRNIHDSVGYVGMATCRSCHTDIYNTFIQTGMGQSFGTANPDRSKATFGPHALVFDTISDLYYYPFFQDSTLFIQEFRLSENGDTLHNRQEKVAYIVGSGHHTNSHILNVNGYVYQAPITFYTQKGQWDLAPGYEEGNERFARFLTSECLTCHNNYPKPVEGALNKYADIPEGIACERCHGPGALHVKEKLAGIVVDTALGADYSIVNPRRLPRDLQMDVCQRCHLQGISILEEGKSYYDFRPGMPLNQIMNVFLPRFTNSHEKFIMASQADRLRLSACYLNSDMSCITCHNPHETVQGQGNDFFNTACKNCHQNEQTQNLCTENKEVLASNNFNCVQCHMPPSGSTDIPHINITDHYISKDNIRGKSFAEKNSNGQFLGLQILTKTKASNLEMARAYIALYDKYNAQSYVLDSALYYLNKLEDASTNLAIQTHIHYAFALQDYDRIKEWSQKITANQTDAWTAYRVGEAFYNQQDFQTALNWYQLATTAMPFNLDFLEKEANTLIDLNRIGEAVILLQKILRENPQRPAALLNLGYIQALRGDFEQAMNYYDQAIALNPDYEQALLNKAAIHLAKQEQKAAANLLLRILEINPQNPQAKTALANIR